MNALQKLKEVAQHYQVLYVDDEVEILESFGEYLKKFFDHVYVASNGEAGLQSYVKYRPDIVITDISMPVMNGIEMIRHIKAYNESQEVIIISAFSDFGYISKAIALGIGGYLLKPIIFDNVNQELYKTLNRLEMLKQNERYRNSLEEMVEAKKDEVRQLQQEKIDNYDKMLTLLVEMMEERDTYTAGHSQRVAEYSVMIAKAMGYDEAACALLYQAAILHDIGKIAIPDSILLNPKKLNAIEYKLIQEHVKMGYALLHKIPMFTSVADIIVAHHERFDGSGYPYGLKDESILPLSRVMIVADAFDAMTTNRIYKGRKSVAQALEEIISLGGIQFHQEVVDVAREVLMNVQGDHTINQLPQTELEKERFAYFYRDVVTGVHNKEYLEVTLFQNQYEKHYDEMLILFIHDFSRYNERFGWEEGDAMLRRIAMALLKSLTDVLVFRIHGDDFAVLSPKIMIDNVLQRLSFLKGEGLRMSHRIVSLQGMVPESLFEVFEG